MLHDTPQRTARLDSYSSRSTRSSRSSLGHVRPLHKPPFKPSPPYDATSDPNAPPCVFWLNGYCRRASECTFRHDSPFAIHLPNPRDPRGDKPCRYIVNGRCTNGAACPFKHPTPVVELVIPDLPPAPPVAPDPEDSSSLKQPTKKPRKKASGTTPPTGKPAKLFERVIRNCITVHFGPGLEVADVSLPGDTVPLLLTDLPDALHKKELLAILRQHGAPVSLELHRSAKRPLTATATYATQSYAVKALRELDGLLIDTTVMHASLVDPVREPTQAALRTTAVKLVWDPPTHTATLYYKSSTFAHYRLSNIHGRVFNGQRLVAFYQDERRPCIVIPDLAISPRVDDLRVFARAESVSFSPASYEMNDARRGLTALLSKFGPLESFSILAHQPGDNKVRAVACFTRSEHLEAAMTALHGLRQPCVAFSRVWLHRAFSVKYVISPALFEVIKDRVMNLRTDERSFTTLRVGEPSGSSSSSVVVYVQGDDPTFVTQLKGKLEAVLRGELLIDSSGRALWDSDFFTGSAGRPFLDALHAEGKVHVACDARERRVSLYGPPDDVEEAKSRILWRYGVHQGDRRVMRLQPSSVRHFVKGGLRALQAVLGTENVWLNFDDQLLVFRCSDEQIGTVRRAANHLAYGRGNLADRTSRKGKHSVGGLTCPVCHSDATDVVHLPCGHDYCLPCLQLYLVSSLALETRVFPLRCIASSSASSITDNRSRPPSCDAPLPVATIRKLLTPDEEHALLDASFVAYVRSHASLFKFCPTPDCEQVYRVAPASSPTVFTCPSCLASTCTACHSAHPGLSCARHRSSLAAHHMAPDVIKHCPSGCGALLQKLDGCNHVVCPICKVHMCWRCMQTFPHGGVYDHIARVHGEGVIPGVLPADVLLV
ncbi:hypothetical protein EXIGLDRAFT_723147 [Exidia glandulosa HHB12029]|uniref:Uncharacterized protein n=1 Tax=Exidia glandulosa HHB12029 TaxID=1314781 RepID=A0A165MZB1_EXIGL|nr:hypothetical protein EXIGLDRAFT_723147 [Exidia glandulosa HHB12029]